jgi:hypothetical protein
MLDAWTGEQCSVGLVIGFNRMQHQKYFGSCKRWLGGGGDRNRKGNMDKTGLPTVPFKLPKVISKMDKRLVLKVITTETEQTGKSCLLL